MKVMLDTNIIISAVLFPNGRAAQAFLKSLSYPYEPIVCDYVLNELRRKFDEKFPDKASNLYEFLQMALLFIEVVPTPTLELLEERQIRDPKDRPILRAALKNHADLFLTGNKDFLESSVPDPRIISVAEFLSM